MQYSHTELCNLFLSELKQYNSTNYKTLVSAKILDASDAIVHKAFSSVVTRFFIFKEKHPELTDAEIRVLYFKLGIDTVAQYFSEYPEGDVNLLLSFQSKLKAYANKSEEVE